MRYNRPVCKVPDKCRLKNGLTGPDGKRKENRLTELYQTMKEQDELNEDIIRTLRKLNAISRRGPGHRPESPEPPRPAEPGSEPPEGPGPDVQRERGRGRLMGTLHDHGPMSQSRLAELLDIRPQSLSELLVKMEGDGLIARAQSSEDRRQIIVSLTDAGSQRVAAFREMQRRHAEAFLAPLTADEKITLAALLKKLTDAPHDESSADGEKHPGARPKENGDAACD